MDLLAILIPFNNLQGAHFGRMTMPRTAEWSIEMTVAALIAGASFVD
jgi:hypothetical protein